MKGQYRTVMEVLFFGIGLAITIYVSVSFSGIRASFTEVAVVNQLNSVGNIAESAITKVSLQKNAVMRLRIPDTVSEQTYTIKVENGAGDVCLLNEKCYLNLTSSAGISIRKEIFNTAENYNIKGSARSGDEFIKISNVESGAIGIIDIGPDGVL